MSEKQENLTVIINFTHLGAFLSILATRTSRSRFPLCHRRISLGYTLPDARLRGWAFRTEDLNLNLPASHQPLCHLCYPAGR